MGELVSAKEIAPVLGLTPRAVAQRAERESWPVTKQGRSKVWSLTQLPPDIQARFGSLDPAQGDGLPGVDMDLYHQSREKDRRVALMRLSLIQRFNSERSVTEIGVAEFVQHYNAGHHASILKVLGPTSEKTFYRWIAEYRRNNLSGILPKWSMRNEAPSGRTALSDQEKEVLRALYLDQRKLSAQACWNEIRLGPLQSRASYATVLRYLTMDLDKSLVALHREGPTAFRDKYLPTVNRDRNAYQPMEQVQSDHHNFDFFIKVNGELVRPWVTVWVDFFSGKPLAWMPSLGPNSQIIGLSFALMVARYGAPMEVHTDNGKDYLSKALKGGKAEVREEQQLREVELEGLYALVGSRLILATPYNGKSKARTERYFGSIKSYFDKRFPTYAGSNTVTRPEDAHRLHRAMNRLPQIKVEGLDFGVFAQALDEFMTQWSANWRGEGKGMDGMTPDEMFDSRPSVARSVNPEIFETHFGTPFVRTVRKQGVEIDGISYYHRTLIEHHFGEKVLVRRIWHRPGEVIVSDLEGRQIARAIAGQFNETEQLEKVLEFKARELKYFNEKARALKVRGADTEPAFLKMAAGHEHQSLPNPNSEPFEGPAKPKLINPLDVGYTPLE